MDKKLSQNVSVKIGGKNFSINDIEKYKPQHKEEHSISNMEHAPRDIRKTLQNEANTIKTNIQVQKNTDVSLSHFANVKGTEKIALPGSSAIGFTNSVQTASETVRAAENRAEQAIQETSYKPSHIVNNTVTSKAEGSNRIQSSLSSIPIVADSVSDNAAKPETFALPLVGTSLSHSSGVIGTGGFKANLTDGSAIGLAHNIQTASETTRATENRVIHTTQETTYKPSHIINNAAVLKAQSASIPDVENEIRSTPYFSTPVVAGNVPNLGTGSNRIQSSLSSISPIVADSVSDNAPKPEIYAKPLVSTSLPHSSGVIGIGSFKANLTGGSAIGFAHNIQTASETARATENRVVHTTQETTYKPSHIITNAAVPKTQQTQQITASIPDEENENRSMPSFSIPVVAGNVQNRGGYTIGMAYLTTGLTKYNNDYARRIKDIENLEIAVDIAKKRAETSLNNASELFIKFNANPTVKASELWQTAYNDYLKDYDDFKKTNRTYIQKYNSLSDHGVTTYRMLKTAAEQRVLQSTMRTNYTFFGLIKNAQIEAKASLLESLSKYRIQSPPISTLSLTGNALASGGKQIVGKVDPFVNP